MRGLEVILRAPAASCLDRSRLHELRQAFTFSQYGFDLGSHRCIDSNGCARGVFDPVPGVIYEFCASRAARHPVAFINGWSGTLTCDDYGAYDIVFKLEDRI